MEIELEYFKAAYVDANQFIDRINTNMQQQYIL